MIGKLMKDWAGNLKRGEVCACFVFAVLFAWAVLLPELGKFGLKQVALFSIGLSIVSASVLVAICDQIKQINRKERVAARRSSKQVRIAFLLCFAALEVSFLAVLLSNWPGFCSTDSNDIVNQVLGVSEWSTWHRYDGLANHHPIFYTFLVWVVFQATAFFGSVDLSIGIFLFLQMTVAALVLSWCISVFVRLGFGKRYILAAFAFMLFNPILANYSVTMWKDVLFSCCALFLIVRLYSLLFHGEKKHIGRTLLVACLLLTFLRSNGFVVVGATLLVLFAIEPDLRKKVAAVGAAVLCAFLVVQGPLLSIMGVQKGHFSESVGIPLQQIAATVQKGGHINEEQEEFINRVLPMEAMRDSYNPQTPNPIKFHESFDDAFLEEHKIEFLVTWASMLPDNLGIYVKAWIDETQGYWNPGYPSWLVTNSTLYEQAPRDYLGFDWDPGFLAQKLIAALPVPFSSGTLIWAVAALVFVGCVGLEKKKRARCLVCVMPLIALLATLFVAAPAVGDYRYIFAFNLALPFVLPIACLVKAGRPKA